MKGLEVETRKKPKRQLKEYKKGNVKQAITPGQAREIILLVAEGQSVNLIAFRMRKDPKALGQHLIRLGFSPQQTKKHRRVIRLW